LIFEAQKISISFLQVFKSLSLSFKHLEEASKSLELAFDKSSLKDLQMISGLGFEGQKSKGINKPKKKDKEIIYLIFI
jgi:hypothetical protein